MMYGNNRKALRPWYGTWPPRVHKGGVTMEKRERKGWWARIPSTTMAMAFAFAFGILFVILSYRFESTSWDHKLMHDIGIAFTVAGLLGVGVDQALRKQLAEDAFKASIGYLLPEELRGEMEWIYSTHILCVEHIQTCELREIDTDTCAIRIGILRKFRNISSSNETLTLGVATDEWFHKGGTSKILAFGYTKLGTKIESFETVKTSHAISIKEQEISLAPQEEIAAWFEVEEFKRRNDAQLFVFGYPTLNPMVTVRAFEGIEIEAGFGYRSTGEELAVGTYRLRGTLLPSQGIQIRWWEREKGEIWANETSRQATP
jgi:hypothetical protein